MRFHRLINRRHRARLENRHALEVWANVEATYRSQILGPHFEPVCRRWTDRSASDATLGGPAGPSASVQLNDSQMRQAFEQDVISLQLPSRAATTKTVQLVGVAKAYRLDVNGLERLDHLGDLLARRPGVTQSATAQDPSELSGTTHRS